MPFHPLRSFWGRLLNLRRVVTLLSLIRFFFALSFLAADAVALGSGYDFWFSNKRHMYDHTYKPGFLTLMQFSSLLKNLVALVVSLVVFVGAGDKSIPMIRCWYINLPLSVISLLIQYMRFNNPTVLIVRWEMTPKSCMIASIFVHTVAIIVIHAYINSIESEQEEEVYENLGNPQVLFGTLTLHPVPVRRRRRFDAYNRIHVEENKTLPKVSHIREELHSGQLALADTLRVVRGD